MKSHQWPLFLFCTIVVFHVERAGAETRVEGNLSFSAQPTDAELSAARVFDEPLIPLSAEPSAKEDKALAEALAAYAARSTADDCSSLAGFADNFPQSRWTASLLLHLGTEYYNYGYFSKALDAWRGAWDQFRTSDYAPAKPQADRALGELARMYAQIGRAGELSALLSSTQGRDLAGPGSQLMHAAGGILWTMLHKPDYAFGCGPAALDRILLRLDPSKAGSPILLEAISDTNGFALDQVAEISRKLGMNYQMAHRELGAEFLVPAVVHWKVGHYAALVERRDDRILAQDYTFASSLWITPRAVEEEGSGYYLVPEGPLPKGWRSVSPAEGRTIWGKGHSPKDNSPATAIYDVTSGGSNCVAKAAAGDGGSAPEGPFGLPAGAKIVDGKFTWHGPEPPIAPPTIGRPGASPFGPSSGGMATYTMHALLVSLTLQDTPVQFTAPFGPQVSFTATYNQLEANQPANFYYSNLGAKWDFNWLSFIIDNSTSPGADVSLYVEGGGTLSFNNFNLLTQTYALEVMSQTRLVRLTASSYELQYPDGSRREYAMSDGSSGSTRRIFLTQVIDPAGNSVQLNYDPQLRITNIVNAIGQAMTLL
jgi:YD repeat-containing protein